jgi:hypothetical protein
LLLKLLPLTLLLTGCPKPCSTGFIGDPSLPVEAELVYTDGVMPVLKPVSDGMIIPLEPPPQGGYVMYIGARARNLDGCGVAMTAHLRDPATGDEAGSDGRSTTLVKRDDGWGWPDTEFVTSNVPNVGACGDYTHRDIQGQRYTLELDVVDRGRRSIKLSTTIVPTCGFSGALQQDCLCECSADYMLGKICSSDGGATD